MPKVPDSFEGAVAKSISDWLHTTMPGVAASLGPLPDTVEPSRNEKLERWNLRADAVQAGPMTDALADEALRLVLEEQAQQGQPHADPDTLTKLVAAKVNAVLYPYRKEVYGRGVPRAPERVKASDRFARLARQQLPRDLTLSAAALPASAATTPVTDATSAPAAPGPLPPPAPTADRMPESFGHPLERGY